MTEQSAKQTQNQYAVPFAIMVFLFFLVGFLTVVNQQFQAPLKEVFDLSNTQSTLLTFTFFAAYPIMGIPAGKLVEKLGYKGTLLVSLVIVTISFALFYTAAEFTSFTIFLIGSFVLGAGMTVLQTVVNPYIIACGPEETASFRMNLGGGMNSLGTVLGPLFVSQVVFGGTGDIQVSDVKIPYLVLIATVIILTLILKTVNLPHIPGTTKEEGSEGSATQYPHLILGVVGIFCYVGAEVAVGANINLFLEQDFGYAKSVAASFASLYWLGLMIGRLSAAGLLKNIGAKGQLTGAATGALALIVGTVILSYYPDLSFNLDLEIGLLGISIHQAISVSCITLILMGLFHSVMWPCIFTLAVKDLGPHTSQGSGLLMLGVAGGAVIPFVQGILADVLGDWQLTWGLVIACELFILFYALKGSQVILPKKK
ncbi:MFS transporter [Sediminitomix flava]|uniref:FHS family L-fucose permease-like MFS transporter n=1 Tax=Sediminitomix flava TaxID=379075 RepID=A0A315ZK26_SEDFL|nr:MFS transporter [Sediminitomix flava]PWJ45044.1 FHS family L-fucose permease-like MFS transporter [Sediminitomix flava]